MELIDNRIIKFIEKHHVMTVASYNAEQPWVAHCFYVFDEKNLRLLFTSENTTRHSIEFGNNYNAAVSIVLESKVIGKLQGLQLEGEIELLGLDNNAMNAYKLRFPYTALMSLNMWTFNIRFAKYTDNNLGFGKKIYWNRND